MEGLSLSLYYYRILHELMNIWESITDIIIETKVPKRQYKIDMLSNSHSDIFTGVHVHEMRAPGVFRYLEGRGGDSFFLGGEQNQSDFLPLPQQVLKITKICKICHIFPNFSSFFPVYHFFSFHLFIPLSFFLYILGRTGGGHLTR